MRGRTFRPKALTRSVAHLTRAQAIRRAARDLQRHRWPRLEMSLIVAVTGFAGFLASTVLLALGVEEMWQRYPLAVGIAYLVFLIELWAWMHLGDPGDSFPDINLDWWRGGGSPPSSIGEGGSFGGGGASGSWEDAGGASFDAGGDSSGVLDSVGDLGDAADGEGCAFVIVVLLVVALAGTLLASAFYLVWGAPMLLAEVLVDGVLSFGLYRNLRRHEREFWLFTAVRRTGLVFVGTAGLLLIIGAALAHQVPGARSMGEALEGAKAASKGQSK
jgi:hypothetical protein